MTDLSVHFPTVHKHKKNYCSSVLSFVAHLKKVEDFCWPTNEVGASLRKVLAVLADRFCSEYPASTPDLVAQIQAVALYGSDHRDSFLLEFHTSLCYSDSEFPIFLQDCSMGESDSLKLTFVSRRYFRVLSVSLLPVLGVTRGSQLLQG